MRVCQFRHIPGEQAIIPLENALPSKNGRVKVRFIKAKAFLWWAFSSGVHEGRKNEHTSRKKHGRFGHHG
jgi:hypothetical protein